MVRKLIFSFVAIMIFCVPEAHAQDFGQDLYCEIRNLMTGNLGTLIGLSVAFSGFVFFIVKDDKSYLNWILVGIAVTAYPGLFESFVDSMGSASSAVNASKQVADDRRSMYASCSNRTIMPDSTQSPSILVLDSEGNVLHANGPR